MKGRTAGLTVIELIIALAVASIAFAALAYSQITGFRVTRSSQGAAIAKDLGMAQLEHLRGLGFDTYRDCPVSSPPADAFGESLPGCSGSTVDQAHPGFEVAWEITASPTGASLDPPALKGLEITVAWEDSRYVLIGYLSCGDPGEAASTEVPCPTDSLLTGGKP